MNPRQARKETDHMPVFAETSSRPLKFVTTRRTAPPAKWSCAALNAGTPGHHFSCAGKRHLACLKPTANRTQSKGAKASRTNARRGGHPFQATEPVHDKPSRRRRVRQPATGHRRPTCPQDGQRSAADNAIRSRRHGYWNHEPLHRSRERKPQIRDGDSEDHGRHGLATALSLSDTRHQLQKREKPPARTAVINRRVAQAENGAMEAAGPKSTSEKTEKVTTSRSTRNFQEDCPTHMQECRGIGHAKEFCLQQRSGAMNGGHTKGPTLKVDVPEEANMPPSTPKSTCAT